MFNKKGAAFPPSLKRLGFHAVIGMNICDYSFPSKRIAIISDTQVANLYGRELQKRLSASLFIMEGGEASKTRQTKERLEDALQKEKFGRDTLIVALGGGVVLDMAGFIAATYCRGVSLIHIPTTLLAMVDAAIGGKNGVNTPFAKNSIGSYYSPEAVLIDTSFLKTLPEKELKNGYVEMFKHGLIADAAYFYNLLNLRIEEAIERSCEIKKTIVDGDPYEKLGTRQNLNFGHTIGHALELSSDFKISHGEAVAFGIRIESLISYRLGILKEDELQTIDQTLKPYSPQDLAINERFYEAIELDKKGSFRFVLLEKIGKVHSCSEVDRSLIEDVTYSR